MDFDFTVPDGMTYTKSEDSLGIVYEFRNQELGTLGQIVIRDVGLGEKRVSCLIAEDPHDPIAKKRKDIFKDFGLDLAERMARSINTKPAPMLPTSRPRKMIQSKMMTCEKCNAGVAYLIFAVDAMDIREMKEYARSMMDEFRRHNLPTWVIGPMLEDGGPIENAPAPIMKIWPEQEAVKEMRPNEFNSITGKLADAHCQ
jgi:hypothetical protein